MLGVCRTFGLGQHIATHLSNIEKYLEEEVGEEGMGEEGEEEGEEEEGRGERGGGRRQSSFMTHFQHKTYSTLVLNTIIPKVACRKSLLQDNRTPLYVHLPNSNDSSTAMVEGEGHICDIIRTDLGENTCSV